MCGIVGYVGRREAAPILLDGLAEVEYRGYDSAGVAVVNGRALRRVRAVGRLGALKQALASSPASGSTGIAHTRWATHGRVTVANAHPHGDCLGKIAVVHNGVVENAAELRAKLETEGHRFESETDSEVLVHLIEESYDGDVRTAVQKAVSGVEGSLAVVVASEYEPGRLVAYRRRSPLMVGEGDGETFVGSDIATLGAGCRTVYALEEGETAILKADGVLLFPAAGETGSNGENDTHGLGCGSVPAPARAPGLRLRVRPLQWGAPAPKLDPDRPIMIQEIHQQPEALRRLLSSWIDEESGRILPPGDAADVFRRAEPGARMWFVGCGTAYYAARAATWAFRKWCGADVRAEIASEFRYFTPDVRPGDLCVAVTQSGETADTLEAMYEAKRRGAATVAVVNQPASTAARDADVSLSIEAGREVAVASTKAYVNQVALLNLLAARRRGSGEGGGEAVSGRDEAAFVSAALRLPAQIEQVLAANEEAMRRLARRWEARRDALFIGRGIDYEVAMEGQLKLKEVSYVHAESVPAGELKHGTLALVDPGFPVVALATDARLRRKTEGSISEVRARGAEVLAIVAAAAGDGEVAADHLVALPVTLPELTPILSVVPMQLLAHYSGIARGLEVDRPRNLAKSVTVE